MSFKQVAIGLSKNYVIDVVALCAVIDVLSFVTYLVHVGINTIATSIAWIPAFAGMTGALSFSVIPACSRPESRDDSGETRFSKIRHRIFAPEH
jgi:arginine exporter protein ArgO